ncbi:hypothetical protein BOTBODRAFT_279625 [Botryobasidium botryosum FD-172 SS1]|uniref:Uncharacterized protein n=1 Tax=Botryobasidium botryosum (strain FD-172 SS1) TaxID=930990 RepID=A0A067M244_BOTB1|nr:hypothetical protein BOTBODRAFT_279625 [Botryobasidium botryosum FD-172 SS1]
MRPTCDSEPRNSSLERVAINIGAQSLAGYGVALSKSLGPPHKYKPPTPLSLMYYLSFLVCVYIGIENELGACDAGYNRPLINFYAIAHRCSYFFSPRLQSTLLYRSSNLCGPKLQCASTLSVDWHLRTPPPAQLFL